MVAELALVDVPVVIFDLANALNLIIFPESFENVASLRYEFPKTTLDNLAFDHGGLSLVNVPVGLVENLNLMRIFVGLCNLQSISEVDAMVVVEVLRVIRIVILVLNHAQVAETAQILVIVVHFLAQILQHVLRLVEIIILDAESKLDHVAWTHLRGAKRVASRLGCLLHLR
jgi:hypothetical protein